MDIKHIGLVRDQLNFIGNIICESITTAHAKDLRSNIYIAGGCFKNVLTGIKTRDYDVFCTEREYSDELIEILRRCNNESLVEFIYENDNAVSFIMSPNKNPRRIEIIKKVSGSPGDVIKNFDWTVTKFAMYRTDDIKDDTTKYNVIYHNKFFEHLMQKKLVIDEPLKYPVSSFNRMLKYYTYGFTACHETKSSLLDAIRKSNDDIDVGKSLYDGID
jgi:hypothetical protein